jgi:hypothetical protein
MDWQKAVGLGAAEKPNWDFDWGLSWTSIQEENPQL